MGQLIDLIDSQIFRRQTAMRIGTNDFSGVAWFLRGYNSAIRDGSPDSVDEMKGFREWLQQRLGGSPAVDWASLITLEFGSGRDATNQFFSLFDEFRNEVAARGLGSILRDHLEYERRRYGFRASSEYRDEGFDHNRAGGP